jgi:hypothetical protein
MLAQLATLKARLALDPTDATHDALLARAIVAVSARFDQETNRTLGRTVDFQQEFDARDTELVAACYPIESVSKFELKTSQAGGWIDQPNLEYLIRRNCIISLSTALNLQPVTCNLQPSSARVTYTGGYLLPGSADVPSATNLPADLEQAALEQTAFWFQTRDKLGVIRQWPKGGSYEQFADTDLLPSVRAILQRHTRFTL